MTKRELEQKLFKAGWVIIHGKRMIWQQTRKNQELKSLYPGTQGTSPKVR